MLPVVGPLLLGWASASTLGDDGSLPLPSSVAFSWATVQPFFHADNITGPYSEEAIAEIAKFPLVTLEKWHGACEGFVPANKDDACPSIGKDAYPCCEEKRMVADLQRVKAINPNASTVMYFNMVLDFPQYELHHQMLAHPHWALALPNGSRCQMSGDSGPATKNPDPEGRPGTLGGMDIFDFAQSEVVDAFVAACVGPVRAGHADGCFLDRAISCVPTNACALGESGCLMCPYLSAAHKQAWNDGHAAVLAKIQQGIGTEKPLIANHATALNSTNAAQLENFFQGETGGVAGIRALLDCTANNKLCEAHFTIGSDCANITNPLAAFLIGAGRQAYFGCGAWHVHDTSGKLSVGKWHHCFDKKLGEPVGAVKVSGPQPGCNASWMDPTAPWSARADTNCSFERRFASGTVVTFDGATNTGGIAWAGDALLGVDPAHSCDTADPP